MQNIQLPFSVSGSLTESFIAKCLCVLAYLHTVSIAAWQCFHIKKRPVFPNIPNGYSPRRRSPKTPRYHFLLPVFTSHLSPILRLSVQTNRLPFNGGIPSVLLAVPVFIQTACRWYLFCRAAFSHQPEALCNARWQKVLSCSSHLNVKLLNSCHYSLFFSFVNSLCLYFLYIFYI